MNDVPAAEPVKDKASTYQTTETASPDSPEPAAAGRLVTDETVPEAALPSAPLGAQVGSAVAGTGASVLQDHSDDQAEYQLLANPRALARLSFASAVTIASLVCLQDAVAILPGATDFAQWATRVAGLWLNAYFVWAIVFFGLCLLVGIVFGGIRIDSDGMKLWRFGKKILWRDIRAVGLEEQPVFSAIFLLRPPAARITIYCDRKMKTAKKGKQRKPKAGNETKPGLSAHAIPSFSFAQEDFHALFGHICKRAFGAVPNSPRVNISDIAVRDTLRAAHETGRVKRIAVSCLIAFSLVFLLGRRSLTNYYYNEAYRLLRMERVAEARDNFKKATAVDPQSAISWDRLARMEYRLGAVADAAQHWERALFLKPDLVDSKIGLASIAVKQCRFEKARALLEKSVLLQPRYLNGYLSLADLELRTGNPRKAERALRFVLKQEPANHKAVLLLARTKMELRDLNGAGEVLSHIPPAPSVMDKQFERLVESEYAIMNGDLKLALEKLAILEKTDSTSYEVYLACGNLHERLGQYDRAREYYAKTLTQRPQSVWPLIFEAEMALKENRRDEFTRLMKMATAARVTDPAALAYAAGMLKRAGDEAGAKETISRALELDPTNENGLETLNKVFQGNSG